MNRYGEDPAYCGKYDVKCSEMMFYQYLPVKMIHKRYFVLEKRLLFLTGLLHKCADDYVRNFGYTKWYNSYVYLTIKHMWQEGSCSYNRAGWHSDSFMSNDINYIWSNSKPTIFNSSEFNLTQDDKISLKEMQEQALPENNFSYDNNCLLRLNQYNIHKVNDSTESGMRTFFKMSVSDKKYDLAGNSHNYELDYNWNMRPRAIERNVPQNAN